MLLTLEQINLTEEELTETLCHIYEAEDHPEKDLYAQFIGEATLDQKMKLLVKEGIKSSFDLVTRLIRIQEKKCLSLNDHKEIWKRQRHVSQCSVSAKTRMIEAAEKMKYGDSETLSEWKHSLKTLQEKILSYDDKFGTE